ncbi:MAG: hypothetical protein R3178_10230, partial [Rhodothermales bacterium]|nr:hypothetical protein [Rhodothermales bacterium]
MEAIDVRYPDGRQHPIVFDSVKTIGEHMLAAGLQRGVCIVVTDKNVANIALEPVLSSLQLSGWNPQVFATEPGEGSKS